MKIYIYKHNGNVSKVEDNRFVQNGSGDIGVVNKINFYFVDQNENVVEWADINWVKLAVQRQDGLTIRPLNVGYDVAEKAWTYTITETSGILGLDGAVEISALFVSAEKVEEPNTWKNPKVLASVAVVGKVLRNVNYDGATYSSDIERLEEGIDGLQGQIVETNLKVSQNATDILLTQVDLSNTKKTVENQGERLSTVEQEVTKLKEDVVGVYQFKGSVGTYAELLTKSDTAEIGDVWEVRIPDGTNYAWVGKSTIHPDGWDALGQIFTLRPADYRDLGGVIVDYDTMTVDKDGKIAARPATNNSAGIVQPDGVSVKIKDGKLVASADGASEAYTNEQIDLILKSIDYNFDGTLPDVNQLVEPVYLPQTTDEANPQTKELDYAIGIKDTKTYKVRWYYDGVEQEQTAVAAFTPTAEGVAIPTLEVDTLSVGENFVIYDGAVGNFVNGAVEFTEVGDVAMIVNGGKAFTLFEIKEVEGE